MRTIKFRVWIYDKQVEDGYLNDEYYQFHRDNEGYYVYEDWRDAEDGRSRRCIPMQFTELYDKNGKEIYEGDIIKGETRNFTVKFEEGMFTTDVGKYILNGDYEIIGNVFENPELVKL